MQFWQKVSTRSLRWVALTLISIYQAFLRPWLTANCRYQPTCSHYAAEAFLVHPPIRAFYLTIRRLLRCHPLGGFGFDPVPSADKKGAIHHEF